MDKSAPIAHEAARNKIQLEFPICDVAVSASADGVWVVVRECLLLDSGIEVEESLFVVSCGEFSELHGLVVRRLRVLGLAYLHDCALAVPSVWRVVGLPERVCDGQRDPVECGMLRSHLAVIPEEESGKSTNHRTCDV